MLSSMLATPATVRPRNPSQDSSARYEYARGKNYILIVVYIDGTEGSQCGLIPGCFW